MKHVLTLSLSVRVARDKHRRQLFCLRKQVVQAEDSISSIGDPASAARRPSKRIEYEINAVMQVKPPACQVPQQLHLEDAAQSPRG